MKADYEHTNLQQFPLNGFAEEVYHMRLEGRATVPDELFLNELQCMARHKMVVSRQILDAQRKAA